MLFRNLLALAALVTAIPTPDEPGSDVELEPIARAKGEPAPFIGHEDQQVVPGSYIVALYKNYTLTSHFEYVGSNLTTLEFCDEFSYFTLINAYHIKTENDTLINDVIRMDPGVEYVEADVVWTLDDDRGMGIQPVGYEKRGVSIRE